MQPGATITTYFNPSTIHAKRVERRLVAPWGGRGLMLSFDGVNSLISDYEIILRVSKQLVERAANATEDADRHFWLGQAAYEMKDYPIAYDHYKESDRLKPTDEIAGRLALCCWRKGSLDEARRWISEALTRNPDGRLQAYCIGTVNSFLAIRSAFELESGEVYLALETANQALKADTNSSLALITKANSCVAVGDFSEALRVIEIGQSDAPPYLRRVLDAVKDVVVRFQSAHISGTPLLHDFAVMASRRAI